MASTGREPRSARTAATSPWADTSAHMIRVGGSISVKSPPASPSACAAVYQPLWVASAAWCAASCSTGASTAKKRVS